VQVRVGQSASVRVTHMATLHDWQQRAAPVASKTTRRSALGELHRRRARALAPVRVWSLLCRVPRTSLHARARH
jgi:hypothetical protein